MTQLLNYQKKISGPLMDRIDLVVHVARASEKDFLQKSPTSDKLSDAWRTDVTKARERQRSRNLKGLSNAQPDSKQLLTYGKLSDEAEQLLQSAAAKMQLSARSYFKAVSYTHLDVYKRQILAIQMSSNLSAPSARLVGFANLIYRC